MQAERDQSAGFLTPSEIEAVHFPEAAEGYDRAHVESFQYEMARHVRFLTRELEIASNVEGKGALSAGRLIGDMLAHAASVAEQIRIEAARSAEVLLNATVLEVAAGQAKVEEMIENARSEAARLTERANIEASRLKEEGAHVRRLAEVQTQIAHDDTLRETRKIKDEAAKRAEEITRGARLEQEALLKKLRELREIELKMVERVKGLTRALDQLTERPAQISLPESSELDEPAESV